MTLSRFDRLSAGLLAGTLFFLSAAANAMDDNALGDILDKRVLGDSSGVCIAAAMIEGDRVARAWRCADPANAGRIGPDVAFEIGSVTKTMTGILLADLIAKGEASLDDPLAGHLPEGTVVPDYEGQPILLRHVVTHTSGSPQGTCRTARRLRRGRSPAAWEASAGSAPRSMTWCAMRRPSWARRRGRSARRSTWPSSLSKPPPTRRWRSSGC